LELIEDDISWRGSYKLKKKSGQTQHSVTQYQINCDLSVF
jgi:hypothetical protein